MNEVQVDASAIAEFWIVAARDTRVLEPPPDLTVADWADTRRVLSSEASAEAGRWDTSRAEYQRGPMNAVSDPATERVTLLWGSQLGKTEVELNVLGYFTDQDPSPVLVVVPTYLLAESFSKDRVDPMIRDTPALKSKVLPEKSRDSGNTILHKRFPGGHLTLVGANSPAGLASRPIRVLLLDEVDRFPANAGNEGDVVRLAEQRTRTFHNRKIIASSTPTVEGASRIVDLYEASDRREYFVPCPKCGGTQVLSWSGIRFERDASGSLIEDSVHYACGFCRAELREADKFRMIASGSWVAQDPTVRGHAGFRINSLYSPWVSWVQLVKIFLEDSKRPETLRTFVNLHLAETWSEMESYQFNVGDLNARGEAYDKVPSGSCLLTAGVDVQDDRIEVSVYAWGDNYESWLLNHRVLIGRPISETVWESLDDYLNRELAHELGTKIKVAGTAIDTGGHYTTQVYEFIRKSQRAGKRYFAIKGWAGIGKPLIGKTSTNNRLRVPLTMVHVDTGKETIYGRLRIEEPGPGFIHFPRTVDLEFFRQLVSERIEKRFAKGVYTLRWVKIHSRNEALDCAVYALAAYHLLNPNMEKVAENFRLSLPTKDDFSQTANGPTTASGSSSQISEPEPTADASTKKVVAPRKVTTRPVRPAGWVNKWRM